MDEQGKGKSLEKKFEELRERLENSSRSNKGFSIILLSYTTYLLVATFSTKDLRLLFPELGVHLPFLNIDINLTAFMIIAPLLLTIIYINSLLNLYKHYELINEYKITTKELGKDDIVLKPIIPFMFDNAFLHRDGDKSAILFKAITYFVLLIYPLLVLWAFFWRFTAYQNAALTFWNYGLLLVAFTSLIVFLYFATKSRDSSKSFMRLRGFVYSLFVFIFGVNFVFLIVISFLDKEVISKDLISTIVNFFFGFINFFNFNFFTIIFSLAPGIIIFSLSILISIKIFLFLFEKLKKSSYKISLKFEFLFIFPFLIIFLSVIQLYAFVFILDLTNKGFILNSKIFSIHDKKGISNIRNFRNGKLLFFIEIKPTEQIPFPDAEKYVKYLETFQKLTKKKKDEEFKTEKENLPRIDLSGRNLKFANLEYIFLPYADLKGANLQYANLRQANLQQTVLWGANLQQAVLEKANLQQAILFNTKLHGVKKYKTIKYKNTLIIAPDFSKPKDIKNNYFNIVEAKKFFNNPRFHDFKGWFEAVKEETIKPENKLITETYIMALFGILRDKKLEKFHKDAWLTIVRFIKYWEKKKPDNLEFIWALGLKEYNQKYSTKELYLTDEEIEAILFFWMIINL